MRRFNLLLTLGLVISSGCKTRNFGSNKSFESNQNSNAPYASTIPEGQFDMVSYWKKCSEHLGRVPTFNYNDSVLVPLYRSNRPLDVTADPHITPMELSWADNIPAGSPRRQFCDSPTGVGRDDKENMACVPASRALRVDTVNDQGQAIVWQVLYRRLSADHEAPPGNNQTLNPNTQYDVQNLIAHNTVTGATCFADAQPSNAFRRSANGEVSPIYGTTAITAAMNEVKLEKEKNPNSIAKVFFSVTGSDWPNLVTGDPEIILNRYKPMFADCTRCHNHGPWTRNPWISQVNWPKGGKQPIVPVQRKKAMAKAANITSDDVRNKAFEPYFIVEEENVKKLLAKVTSKPEVDAQPYSLDVKILNVKDNKCRTCHEVGQRHMCGEDVPMAFGLNGTAPGGNGFGIDYVPPAIFERRLRQYFQSQHAQNWPENGWHNKILGITVFPKDGATDPLAMRSAEAIESYAPSLKQVMNCCQTFQPGRTLPAECKWVRAPHVPGREIVDLNSKIANESSRYTIDPEPEVAYQVRGFFPLFVNSFRDRSSSALLIRCSAGISQIVFDVKQVLAFENYSTEFEVSLRATPDKTGTVLTEIGVQNHTGSSFSASDGNVYTFTTALSGLELIVRDVKGISEGRYSCVQFEK